MTEFKFDFKKSLAFQSTILQRWNKAFGIFAQGSMVWTVLAERSSIPTAKQTYNNNN